MSRPDLDFDSLTELHDSVNEFLSSPSTTIDCNENKLAHEVSEASLKMADSCAAAKDLLLLAKTHLQNLQSAFRRIAATHDGDQATAAIGHHRLPRKQLKKAIMKRLDSLKGMKGGLEVEEDRSLAVVVRLLKEVRATVLSIVRSLLSLIAIPNPGKAESGRRDPVFRIRLTRMDSLSFWERCELADVRMVMKRLEEVEMVVEEMGGELEEMFRRLIRTRASLLNLLTT